MIRIINKMVFFSCLSGVLLFETFMRMIKILRICQVSFLCLLQNGGQTAMDIQGKKPDGHSEPIVTGLLIGAKKCREARGSYFV